MKPLDAHIDDLLCYVQRHDYAGYDPYDALNSPLVRMLTFGHKYGRIAWTQFLRRCPLNLRPLLLMKRGHNPKGIGLFLQGLVRLNRVLPNKEHELSVEYLIELLDQLRSSGGTGNCWGYNFDWQSRAAFVPAGTPTIVNSSFIGHALLDAWEAMGSERARDLALPIADFILRDLNRKREGDHFCFSYTPLDDNYVHNANLLGASLLIRIYTITGEDELRQVALDSLAYSMKHQHEDGSWFYAERPMQQWIDSFHTGFNLQAIRCFLQCGEGDHLKDAYENGVKFYAKNFFLSDGTPKYYCNKVYPIDIHAPCQAIAFFAGEGGEYRSLVETLLTWMLREMCDSKTGAFYFRKGKWSTNKILYMRWSQAWAFNALTAYKLSEGDFCAT